MPIIHPDWRVNIGGFLAAYEFAVCHQAGGDRRWPFSILSTDEDSTPTTENAKAEIHEGGLAADRPI